MTNAALGLESLRAAVGTGPLAGVFVDGDRLVDTPRIGEDGYVPPSRDGDDDGPAQVRDINAARLAGITQHRLDVVKHDSKTGDPVPVILPPAIAQNLAAVPETMPNVRRLRGITHTPMTRSDGSILAAPGYDSETGYLYLPLAGLTTPEVPDRPSADDVAAATARLLYLLGDFPFVSEDDRANLLGMLLLPLVRELVPPPYKLGIIEAPERGSGKSLLARLMRQVHGGVLKIDLPGDGEEFRKLVTTTLATTTAPVVVFDNVDGKIGGAQLAGLLTTAEWTDRLLGGNTAYTGTNNRLWLVTGNNATLAGDLARRTLTVTIDPGMPHPERRTGFAIPDLPGFVDEHRGRILADLLTLVRAWHVAGRPAPGQTSHDDYGQARSVLQGILAHAGIPGSYDARDAEEVLSEDDDELATFLDAVHHVFGDQPFTVADVLRKTSPPNESAEDTRPTPWSAIPTSLARDYNGTRGVGYLSQPLGYYFKANLRRWADRRRVVQVDTGRKQRVKSYRLESLEDGS